MRTFPVNVAVEPFAVSVTVTVIGFSGGRRYWWRPETVKTPPFGPLITVLKSVGLPSPQLIEAERFVGDDGLVSSVKVATDRLVNFWPSLTLTTFRIAPLRCETVMDVVPVMLEV